jgi:hypothetical protein
LRGQNSLSFVSSYPIFVPNVARRCFVRYSLEWSGTVPKVPAVERQGSPEMVGFKWVGLDSLTSHPLHMPSFHLFRLMQLCNWPELGWLIRRSPRAKNACTFLSPYLPSPSLYCSRLTSNQGISPLLPVLCTCTYAWHFPLIYGMAGG